LTVPRQVAALRYARHLRPFTVQGCKVDSLNLRGTRLQDVEFRDGDLTETDFGSATLVGVTSPVRRCTGPGSPR
jgi:uncharacterized protein YjbI with pentapeptide repeats